MDWLAAPDASLARVVLQRGLAAIYLVAFLNVVNQWVPLLGQRGLLPVPGFIERSSFATSPSLFHWRYSDRLAVGLGWVGIALSAIAVAGIPDTWPTLATMLLWLVLWWLYLSYVNVGQIFYGFGWESLLTEAGFLAVLLGPADGAAPPVIVIWLFRWLLFRVEFGAGLIKIRGDDCWRDLTCLTYHHETQPQPGLASWHFHHLPRWMHRVETGANHVVQLGVPFLLLAPQPVATVAGSAVLITQGWLVVSGNFAWLNATTMVLAASAFGDGTLERVLPLDPRSGAGEPAAWFGVLTLVLLALVAWLSVPVVRNLLSRGQRMNA
ncbi:MAG TPA: lipase maturation factor family protein, partial [Nitriliruptorales bacterium]